MVEGWIKIHTSGEEYQGALIVELLKNHGLHPVLLDQRDDEFRFGDVEVYVAPEEVEQAKKILAQNQNDE